MPKNPKKEKKGFFKGMRTELKNVVWPTPKELGSKTLAVIAVVFIVMGLVFVFDLAFRKADEYGISKLKFMVQSIEENKNTTTDEQSAEENTTTEDAGGEDSNTENTAENAI